MVISSSGPPSSRLRKPSQGKNPNYDLNIVIHIDPAVGYENYELFTFLNYCFRCVLCLETQHAPP